MLYNVISGKFNFTSFILYTISALIVIFLTQPIHEWAHAFTAHKLGDNTAKFQGRLTLNPIAHIDWLGAASILFFGFGWAKPVPVNMHRFKNPKVGMAITAFAGPLSNLCLAFASFLLFNVLAVFAQLTQLTFLIYVMLILSFIADINITLAVFNLIPVPPLDGSRILFAFLPDRYYYKLMRYEQYIYIGLLLIIFCTNVFDYTVIALSDFVFNKLLSLASLPFTLFGLL